MVVRIVIYYQNWSVLGVKILFSFRFYLFVSWSTSDLRSQCHLTLTNTGRRELKGSASVRQAVYEARSGIVGGHIEIQELKFRGTRKYHSKHFFIFIGRECTAWPANSCLQIIACSCVLPSKCVFAENEILFMRNCNHPLVTHPPQIASLRVIWIWKQTWLF